MFFVSVIPKMAKLKKACRFLRLSRKSYLSLVQYEHEIVAYIMKHAVLGIYVMQRFIIIYCSKIKLT